MYLTPICLSQTFWLRDRQNWMEEKSGKENHFLFRETLEKRCDNVKKQRKTTKKLYTSSPKVPWVKHSSQEKFITERFWGSNKSGDPDKMSPHLVIHSIWEPTEDWQTLHWRDLAGFIKHSIFQTALRTRVFCKVVFYYIERSKDKKEKKKKKPKWA